MTMIMIMVVCLVVIVVGGLVLLKAWRRNRLTPPARARALQKWKNVRALTDPHRSLMEGDAVLDAVLKDLGYSGTMADKLRRAHAQIPDIENVWRAHKLRNRIAHEPGVVLTPREVSAALDALEKAVFKFCQ